MWTRYWCDSDIGIFPFCLSLNLFCGDKVDPTLLNTKKKIAAFSSSEKIDNVQLLRVFKILYSNGERNILTEKYLITVQFFVWTNLWYWFALILDVGKLERCDLLI